MFLGWVFTAPMPQDRITRACEPINWVGNMATSATALSAQSATATTARWSDKLNYSCRYLIWRAVYQDDYNRAVTEGRVVPGTGAVTAPAQPAKAPEEPTK